MGAAPVAQAGGSSSAPSAPGASPPEVLTAWAALKAFTAAEFRGQAQAYLGSAASRAQLRDALMLAYARPCPEEAWTPATRPEVLLGVVASEARLAVRALRDWCGALGLEFVQPECKVEGAAGLAAVRGAVYVKYNSVSRVCYLTPYQGTDRGVLVQLGPGRLLGHFPLGFFDEQASAPEPALGGGS
ncbi:hypothetical protein HT031_001070 [Scenedesmus sp. PABB004]|nr:hypothetical protein HT031_001070 [Scenedesmus sp. PABB004]